jgi:hypothetical protein
MAPVVGHRDLGRVVCGAVIDYKATIHASREVVFDNERKPKRFISYRDEHSQLAVIWRDIAIVDTSYQLADAFRRSLSPDPI